MGRTETPQAVSKPVICKICTFEDTCEENLAYHGCAQFVEKRKTVQKLSRYDILLGKKGRTLPRKPTPPKGSTVYE